MVSRPMALAVPAWCQYVPDDEKTAACRGTDAGGCTCDGSCSEIPAGSWQWNPQCCGCGAGANTTSAALMVSNVEDANVEDMTVEPLAAPAWCRYVPDDEKTTACRGTNAGGCTCDGSCSDIPTGSWQWNPQCCGCGAGAKSIEAVTMKSAVEDVTSEPLALMVPAWCRYVPDDERTVACRGTNPGGCTCDGS